MKIRILFLGPPESPLFEWLQAQGESVEAHTKKITPEFVRAKGFNFLVSYGYRHILKSEILDLFPGRAVNLHISYLPWNRGADPNFWSFLEGTPPGVTIHLIDPGVDTGDILVQKKVDFGDLENATLSSTYQVLQQEIQQLFFENWAKIRNGELPAIPQTGKGTMHRVRDKKPYLHLLEPLGWDTPVSVLIQHPLPQ